MPENKIRPGESIAQWRARISNQAKIKQQEEINKLNEDRAIEAEMSRRRLANAADEEFFEDLPESTVAAERPITYTPPKGWDKFKLNHVYPIKSKLNNLGIQFKYLMEDPITNGKGWIQRHITKNNQKEPIDLNTIDTDTIGFEEGFNTNPYFVALKDSVYGGTKPVPDNANSILFNDFVNETNPHIHTAREWKRMSPETRLKDDRSRRLGDIKYFGGVENGTFKVMPLSEFNDTTTLIPNYFVDAKPIIGITGLPNQRYDEAVDDYHNKKEEYNRKWEELTKRRSDLEQKIESSLDSTYQTRFFGNYDKYINFPDRTTNLIRSAIDTSKYTARKSGMLDKDGVWLWSKEKDAFEKVPYSSIRVKNLAKYGPIASNFYNTISDKWAADPNMKNIRTQFKNLEATVPVYPVRFEVTSADGTKENRFRGTGTSREKYVLGNAKGSYFMQQPETVFEMYPQFLDTLTNAINTTGPLIPFMVDQGAYNNRYWPLPENKREAENKYNRYNVNLYKVGTLSNKQGGIISKLKNGKYVPHQFPDWQDGDKCPTGECAFFSNSQLRDYFGIPAFGNAWELNGEPLYTNPVSKPTSSSKNKYFKYLHDSADQFASDFDFDQLDPNELYQVNMYYNGSPSWQKAEPTGNGTHAGYLQFKDGQWYVVHNIHGNVHVDALNDILGGNQKSYGVLNVYKIPGYNRVDNYKQRLDEYVSRNPMGIWMEDSANVRDWLRKNSPETLQNYWNNLTDEQRKRVDRRFKP